MSLKIISTLDVCKCERYCVCAMNALAFMKRQHCTLFIA